jgi:hypothetical protein
MKKYFYNRIKWKYSLPLILIIFAITALIFLSKPHRLFDHQNFVSAELKIIDSDIVNLGALLPQNQDSNGGTQIIDRNGWKILRLFPSGYLEIFHKNSSGEANRISLPVSLRKEIHPLLIIPEVDQLIVVGYDVIRNIPSGRKLSVTQPGLDVFVATNHQEPVRMLASGVDLGSGIDSMVYGRAASNRITLCSENKCADIYSDGRIEYWNLAALSNYEFVEVSFDASSAYAIVRKKWDDRFNGPITQEYADYFLVKISTAGIEIERFNEIGLPYGLTVKNGRPSYKLANTKQKLAELFIYDFLRMKNGGMIEYGDNNLEGRVAWSQVYYLNGLISAVSNEVNLLDGEIKKILRKRIANEVNLIALLAESDYPGYRVKRYSIDREPLLFALHLGRVAQLLSRSKEEGLGSIATNKALQQLRHELLTMKLTVEHIKDCRIKFDNGLKCSTLFYRRGYPFWADGINVPYNYVSGYVTGLLSVSDATSTIHLSSELMQPLINGEHLLDLPVTWRYWYGEGQRGWDYKDGFSINTPAWKGNAAGMDLAHITYRSMDAAALLMLRQKLESGLTAREIEHFKNLVQQGMLLPQLNEQLVQMGYGAKLDASVAKRFARSSQPWQIQSQAWALSDLVSYVENSTK